MSSGAKQGGTKRTTRSSALRTTSSKPTRLANRRGPAVAAASRSSTRATAGSRATTARTQTRATTTAKRGRSTKTKDGIDIEKVWRDFKRNGDERLRNILIERYLPLVKYIAERLLAKLPQNIELR